MQNWREFVVTAELNIFQTIQVIDKAASKFAVVVDSTGQLLGTVTDGDVRRGILRGIPLEAPVSQVMNSHSEVVSADLEVRDAAGIMRSRQISHLPVVDGRGRLVGVYSLDELSAPQKRDNLVVLMAGGRGQRLAPLTANCPKPMLSVGGRPILETIISSFQQAGFYRFRLSVNYMADVIINHFGDGTKFDCEIQYLEEVEQLGTAGALALLPERPDLPFFVMNGDILTKANFLNLLDFHTEAASVATMCVREYSIDVPFGVIQLENDRIRQIVEKPTHSMFINAGLYLLSPSALDHLPATRGLFNMTDLFGRIIETGGIATSFPLHEYWLDIGRLSDYERAHTEFGAHFS